MIGYTVVRFVFIYLDFLDPSRDAALTTKIHNTNNYGKPFYY